MKEPARLLTAGDIARHIQRPDEPIRAAVDRLNNWTDMGLVEPLGELNPGTGRKKLFSSNALAEAVILQALIDALGGAAVTLRPIVTKISKMARISSAIAAMQKQDGRIFERPGAPEFIILNRPHPTADLVVFASDRASLEKYLSRTGPDIHVVINARALFERIAHNWSDAVSDMHEQDKKGRRASRSKSKK